uniref:Uncharacterized protein n=1 Tax=Nelumbo nucifera TaxID=4432 RepID=A0A822Y6D0_NELNU|nr:TPA_asm: hypothetical protein HUJ06_029538 [Nelumbo nucifera]
MPLAKRQLFKRFLSYANPSGKSLPDPIVGLTLTSSNCVVDVTAPISSTLILQRNSFFSLYFISCSKGLPPPSPRGRRKKEREMGFQKGVVAAIAVTQRKKREKERWEFRGGCRHRRCHHRRHLEEEERERSDFRGSCCRCRPVQFAHTASVVATATVVAQRKKRERSDFRGSCHRRPCSVCSYPFSCLRRRPYSVHSFSASSTEHPTFEEERG